MTKFNHSWISFFSNFSWYRDARLVTGGVGLGFQSRRNGGSSDDY